MKSKMDISSALEKIISRENLSIEQTRDLFLRIMSGHATEAQIAAILIALRVKGECPEELAGAALVMRELSTKVEVDLPNLIDTCGTGGSGSKLFNISTASTFVCAGAGAHIAKHGNRKMTSSCGSADVLEAAGVNLNLNAEQIASCIKTAGVGFLFAPQHHAAMKYAGPVRQQLGVRTMMNVLGPMTNPAGADRQVIGVFSQAWQKKIAEVMKLLDAAHVLVIHSGGLDEMRLDQHTHVVELKEGVISEYQLNPNELVENTKTNEIEKLEATDPESSLKLLEQSITEPNSLAAKIVALNAGLGVYVSGLEEDIKSGVQRALESISSGKAKDSFDLLIEHSQGYAD